MEKESINGQPEGSNQNLREQNDGREEFSAENTPKKKKRNKGLIVFLIILAIFVAVAVLGAMAGIFSGSESDNYGYNLSEEHLSVIKITGSIDNSGSSSVYETSSYNQEWLIGMIESITNEENNRGIILYLDTPGGSVYATDEVYLKLLDYKEKTGNPVYAIMGPTCASGGYYISCASDKIYANRNTVTGSIGVTMGTVVEISELLEKYGIKTTTLVSGDNKAMGSMYDPLTEEQIAIYQSIIDESYEQFTGIVAEGRNMDINTVKALADGRLYTAKQALENGLIDEISNYKDSLLSIQKETGLEDCDVFEYEYYNNVSVFDMIFGAAESIIKSSREDNELATALEMAEGFSITPYYLAQ
ncbi:MAG: signal peptide peptidase SppA [Bacillota bacterium]|nr:signal peptide peptidase SppA [Bacillota bacterium]